MLLVISNLQGDVIGRRNDEATSSFNLGSSFYYMLLRLSLAGGTTEACLSGRQATLTEGCIS
jgi:hypothetical protein